ncbi:transaldolase family protein [Levilactobacillus angrenensis]|uniref:Transaldolase family protein n=1 Tax=Levilactobacillus angrenensis TaxID=2486020 RepID=A0ABW1UA86_9LACO|nr:transaldolase family protein [Levilactobacillus angrenensis]
MKYFLDSAKMDEITYAYENYGIDGVTTNPKHIQASGQPFMVAVQNLADFAADKPDFPISIEINPHLTESADMIAMAEKIHQFSDNFAIKIPATENGIIAARHLEQEGIRTNVTLIFSAAQAIMPAKIGAKYASPFVNWKELNGEDGMGYVKDIAQIYRNYGYQTEIIVAAVRSGHQIVEAAKAGADIVTAGLDVYRDSFYHPYTDLGLKRFQDAWDNTPKEA